MERPLRLSELGLFLALSLAACSESGATDNVGEAFPNRRPSFPQEGRTLGYVSNRLSDSISVLDLDEMVELGRVPAGVSPVEIDGPTRLVIDAERKLAYVALVYPRLAEQGPHAAHSGAPRPGYVQVLSLEDFRELGVLDVDPSPTDLALSEDGETLVVSHYDLGLTILPDTTLEERRSNVTVIHHAPVLVDGSAEVKTVTSCVAPYAIALGEGERHAYVSCTGEESVAVIDLAEVELRERVSVGDESRTEKPFALSASPDRSMLLVSSQVAREVALYSLDDWETRHKTVVKGVPYFAAWLASDRILVPVHSPSGAVLFDDSLEVQAEVTFPIDECLNPLDTRVLDERVFVVCEGDGFTPGAVVKLDRETLAITARVEVGLGADRLQVLPP